MTPDGRPEKRHLRADRFHRSERYASPRSAPRILNIPPKSRGEHGVALIEQVAAIREQHAALLYNWEGREEIRARGIVVEFESPPNVDLYLEQLIDSSGFELLNRRKETGEQGDITKETWYVPNGRLDELDRIFREYLERNYAPTGEPLRRKLVDSIEKMQMAALQQLWTESDPMPLGLPIWFEVWLRAGKAEEREQIYQQYRVCAERVGLRVGENRINLPEHTVIATYGDGQAFSQDLALLNCIAEIRLGRDYADFFENLHPDEQMQLAKELASFLRPVEGLRSACAS